MHRLFIQCSSAYNTSDIPELDESYKVITIGELKQWVISGSIIKQLFHYDIAELHAYRLEFIPKPLLSITLLLLLSKGNAIVVDEYGNKEKVRTSLFIRYFYRWFIDLINKSKLIKTTKKEIESLKREPNNNCSLDTKAHPIYLRTDLWFGIKSGGSVGHIAGVLNNLGNFTGSPIFFTTDLIPTVYDSIEVYTIIPGSEFWGFRELPTFHLNNYFYRECVNRIYNKDISFIYQRYSLNNYAGLKLAQHFKVPFVLEYNGSEVWINRNWGEKLKYEELSIEIENLNLQHANLIVVVSKPMKNELVSRGIKPRKILINPNGVDPNVYNPDVECSAIKEKYGLQYKTVVGFIGTFGKWHGAEVLVESFRILIENEPTYRDKLKLFMIGDGVTMPIIKEAINKHNLHDLCVLTGLVPQQDGPQYLAACDILVSPHVPNPDGSPFFGSPTKLFEYMAMGKGIVASDLEQIGEILEHKKTAWLVRPGDVENLAEGIKTLIEDNILRQGLGRAAREEVVAKYTWKEHTRKIITKLKELCDED